MAVRVLHIGHTVIGFAAISGDGTRRTRETAAVKEIMDTLLPGKTVEHRPDGAPYISGGPYISISHSRKSAVIAANPQHPVGVDIEENREQLERVASRFAAPGELADSGYSLLELWTAKESAYKLLCSLGITPSALSGITVTHGCATFSGTTLRLRHIPARNQLICLAIP